MLTVGGACALSGAAFMFGALVKRIVSSEDPEYDDEGNEIVRPHPGITPAGFTSLALLGTAVITLPIGFIWLRKRRMERQQMTYRWRLERQYLEEKRAKVSLVPQGAGGRLRIAF